MKLTLIAVVLVSMLLVHEAESGWFRKVGRAIRRVWTPVCTEECPRFCEGGIACKFTCRTLCGRRKRAPFINGIHLTPLPRNFDFYDLNDDDFVSLQEIATTLGHAVYEVDLIIAFNTTDIDQDSKLTEEELFSSKAFVFVDDPVEPNTDH